MRSQAVSLFLEAVIQSRTKQPATALLLPHRSDGAGIACGMLNVLNASICMMCFV